MKRAQKVRGRRFWGLALTEKGGRELKPGSPLGEGCASESTVLEKLRASHKGRPPLLPASPDYGAVRFTVDSQGLGDVSGD
jgi:hypothetical protein